MSSPERLAGAMRDDGQTDIVNTEASPQRGLSAKKQGIHGRVVRPHRSIMKKMKEIQSATLELVPFDDVRRKRDEIRVTIVCAVVEE